MNIEITLKNEKDVEIIKTIMDMFIKKDKSGNVEFIIEYCDFVILKYVDIDVVKKISDVFIEKGRSDDVLFRMPHGELIELNKIVIDRIRAYTRIELIIKDNDIKEKSEVVFLPKIFK